MRLVTCWKKKIPTQGPESDPKFKLNISSFLTLSHLLTCLICTKNVMSVVFLLQMAGERISEGWLIYINVWVVGQRVGIIL